MALSAPMNDMSTSGDGFLRDIWYFAVPSSALKPGEVMAKTLLGEPVVLARQADGKPYALRDICPHRGIPLSDGRMVGDEVECCYHGWRFNCEGTCTLIPSITTEQDFDSTRIKVRNYPLIERHGGLWIFMGRPDAKNTTAGLPDPSLPEIPDFADKPNISVSMDFPCHIDHAVIGLMDPAHGPYVHKSIFWRDEKSMHDKAKDFGPSPFGFAMKRHPPSKNAAAYKILGGGIFTEIRFRLPGVRVEHIEAGRYHLCNLTCVTPIGPMQTEVHHMVYWTMPWLTPLKPLLVPFVKRFLGQDRDVVVKQQRGLAFNPQLMLINDSDIQAKWYFRLKKSYDAWRKDGGDFDNPVRDTVLRWRS